MHTMNTMNTEDTMHDIMCLNIYIISYHAYSPMNSPGLLLWNQTRQQWIGDKGSSHRKKGREPAISWNATYDNLLGSNKPFPRPIPLPVTVGDRAQVVVAWLFCGIWAW
ncbi:hypothetical protein CTI12_AA430330 [Artemisia annua]|uniref:Gag1-like clamp domain-containing protein n=1 Tax=Artemisia annua TaxID=35608 RepID=A0A2U1M1V5_ARTAN|nr:hypothetical protein CTI12_AA430330 [Artemisia annua]